MSAQVSPQARMVSAEFAGVRKGGYCTARDVNVVATRSPGATSILAWQESLGDSQPGDYQLVAKRWYTQAIPPLRGECYKTFSMEGHMADSFTPSYGDMSSPSPGQPPMPTAIGEPRLRLQGINKTFGAVRALTDVNFE